LFDAQLLQPLRDLMIDVLGAVVGVEADNDERKLIHDQGQYGQQIGLADPLYAGLDLPLAHGIDTGDVIHPFDAVLITLMNGINAHKAGPSLRAGGFTHADRVAHRAGLGEAPALGLIAGALAQVVQMGDGQGRQTLIAGIVIVPVGPLQEVSNGRPADVFISLVHLHEQLHVDGGVFARKGRGRRTVALGQRNLSQAVTLPAGHQARHLSPAVAAGVLQVPQQNATLALVATGVVKAFEHATDVHIPLAIVACR
jgi:hypothetical protein